MKKIVQPIVVLLIVSFVVVAGLLALRKKDENISIVTTNFPSYDFARAITKGIPDANIKMLVSPGVEIHDYEPTPQDIIDIKNSDYFIYTGGESDHWVENILNNINPDQTKVIRLIDLVETKEDEPISGPEENHDHEDDHHHSDIDEHVWTSLRNSIKIIQALEKEFISQIYAAFLVRVYFKQYTVHIFLIIHHAEVLQIHFLPLRHFQRSRCRDLRDSWYCVY